MGANPENRPARRLCVGLLAHVDAGKTTLSEGMLYRAGRLKKLGRVDHQNAFLDTHALERERGITIFSKQAVFTLDGVEVTLLDTPGHVDFSSEMERTLQVLDCAVLVVSATDGVQGHTATVWELLERYGVPTFVFVNKMDLPGSGREALLVELRERLGEGCVDFSQGEGAALWENVALCGEEALERYLDRGRLEASEIAALVERRQVFPCWFGSALRLEGVDGLLSGLARYAPTPRYPADFGAKIYKIARDPQGARLTYLKVTGGSLSVKDVLSNRRAGLNAEQVWEEKVDQIRLYSGAKFRTAERVEAGTVCAVTGLSRTRPGEGLGVDRTGEEPVLEPVLTYQVCLPPDCDPHTALTRLELLQEEDPQLHVVWDEQLGEIHIQLMGDDQLDELRAVAAQRFGLEVSFGAGHIVYRETIAAPVEGVGHYEPLRHYAEVHLLLEPGPRGSGIQLSTACPEDALERNWQRLILTHLAERSHPGVLTGAPLTDVKITLIAGRAHEKHTEGGDFRQATYRAVRQGLMQARSILLEPWYAVRLELPAEHVGRAMTDLQRMNAALDAPQTQGGSAILTGAAPVSALRDYGREVAAYTRGLGRLTCRLRGYAPCANQEEAVAAAGYDAGRDTANPADSVFCSHGAGVLVKWDQVRKHMHIDTGLRLGMEKLEGRDKEPPPAARRRTGPGGALEQDKELQAIFERTYGPVKSRDFRPAPGPRREQAGGERRSVPERNQGPEYLLVDGYNIIYTWDELKEVARTNLDAARQMLMDLLSNYQGYKQCVVILVFDAYRVPRSTGEISRYHNIYVVFTKQAETADAYIEKATYEIGRHHRVRVATSDGAEQLIILGHGALRVPARAFQAEVEEVGGQIAAVISRNNSRPKRAQPVREAMEKAREREER